MAVDIRPATACDLATLCDIWYEAESAASASQLPVPPDVPAFFRYELETGDMYEVKRNHHILGLISLLTRDSVLHCRILRLSGLSVRQDQRGTPASGSAERWPDHLYTQFAGLSGVVSIQRAGLRPWWPNF